MKSCGKNVETDLRSLEDYLDVVFVFMSFFSIHCFLQKSFNFDETRLFSERGCHFLENISKKRQSVVFRQSVVLRHIVVF